MDDLLLTGQALALGFLVLSLGIFLLGLAGGYYPGVLLGVLLLPLLALRPVLKVLAGAARLWRRDLGWGPLLLWSGIALCALAPNTHFDVQVYHYACPELYLRRHSLQWTWINTHEGLIGPAQLLYVPALALGGESAANLLNCLYLLILLVACRRLSAAPVSWLLLTSPMLIFQAQGGLTDLPAAAYCCLALEALLRSSRQTGLWAGQALAIKWTALGNYLCLLAFCLPRRRLLPPFLLGLLLLVPQLTRNFYYTGDPFSPLLGSWGAATLRGPQASSEAPGAADLPPIDQRWRFPASLIHLSLSDRSWQNAINPLVLLGIALALRHPRRPLERVTLLALLGLTLAGPKDPRYCLPSLCWCACLSATWLQSRPRPLARPRLLALSCLPGLAVLLALGWQRSELVHGRGPYLEKRTASAAFRYLAEHASSDQFVYLLGRRGFRCPIPYVCGDDPPLGRDLPRIDYYVADLREPFLKDLNLQSPALPGRLRLKLHDLGQARVVFEQNGVVVLQDPLLSLTTQPIVKVANLEQVIRSQGQSWEGSSQIWLLDLHDGTRAVFRSEDEPWGSQAEVAGYRFSRWLGLGLVPPTAPRTLRKNEWPGSWPFPADTRQGSLQLYLPTGPPAPISPDTQADIEVLSYIMGRYDNHSGNLIFDTQGRPYLVDFENTLEIQKTKYGQISYVRRGKPRPDLPSGSGDFPYDRPEKLVNPSLAQIQAKFSPWWVYWTQGMQSLQRQTRHLPDHTVHYTIWDHRLWVQARAGSRHPAFTKHYHAATMQRLQRLDAPQLRTLLPAPYGPEHVASMLDRTSEILRAWKP